jgi:hypothetical protein
VVFFDGEVGDRGSGSWVVFKILGLAHFINALLLTFEVFVGEVPSLAKKDFTASFIKHNGGTTRGQGWKRLLSLDFVLGSIQTTLNIASPALGPFIFPLFILFTTPHSLYLCAYIMFSLVGLLFDTPIAYAFHIFVSFKSIVALLLHVLDFACCLDVKHDRISLRVYACSAM